MPGYYESYLHGMNQLLPMARLQEMERNNEFNRQIHTQNMQRLYQGMAEQKRRHDDQLAIAQKNFELRLQQQLQMGTWQPITRDGQDVLFNPKTLQVLDPSSGKITSATAGGATTFNKTQPMPVRAREDLSKIGEDYQSLVALTKSFKPEYTNALGPQVGRLENIVKQYVPFTDSAQADWWRLQEKLSNIPERHQAFGGSVTRTEVPLWERGAINVGMKPDDTLKLLNVRVGLMNRALQRRTKSAATRYNRQEVESAAGIPAPKEISTSIPDLEGLAIEGSRITGKGRPPIESLLGDQQ